MLEKEFYYWLLRKRTDNQNTASSRKSNCLRVCEYEGDLDAHFEKDACQSLIEKLSYSKEDERNNRPPKHKIPIVGNKITGSATLKYAVSLYVEFKNDIKNGYYQLNQPFSKDDSDNFEREFTDESVDKYRMKSESELRDLLEYLIRSEKLFLEYNIYGIEYLIGGKKIDILLEHKTKDELLALELKKDKGKYDVFGQISMYLGLLGEKFSDKAIYGVVIACEIDESLIKAAQTNKNVKLMEYNVELSLSEIV